MITFKFDYDSFKKGVKGDEVQNHQISIPNVILGISEATFGDKVEFAAEVEEDIADSSCYCIQ